MIKFLLVIPLLLSLSAYGAKDYFNEVIEHIENGSLTPQVFEEISMEKLIYLDCFVEADVSMNLTTLEKSQYSQHLTMIFGSLSLIIIKAGPHIIIFIQS